MAKRMSKEKKVTENLKDLSYDRMTRFNKLEMKRISAKQRADQILQDIER